MKVKSNVRLTICIPHKPFDQSFLGSIDLKLLRELLATFMKEPAPKKKKTKGWSSGERT
jgi:hypothetical protein